MTRFVLTVALSLTATVSETTSPADFNNQTQGKWYKAQGRNCSTKARASCNDWSKWSNTIFLSTPPVFAKSAYSFSLAETSDLGTTVGTVSATDADSGDTVTYAITAGNSKGMFAISNSTGKIIVYNFLDHETAGTTTLTIQARDSYGATGTTTVTVTATNVFESTVTASATTPLKGQSATLTASTDVGSLPGAQYQWQRVDTTKNQWVNVGANTTTTTLTLTSATVATEVYRVTATFRAVSAAPSHPVAIEWQEPPISITTNNSFPISDDTTRREATLTATVDGPPGLTYTYQWQERLNGTWTNLGSSSSSTTKDVSYTTRGVRQFRVVASYTAGSTASEPLYLTWDEWKIVSDLSAALATAVSGASDYSTKQTALLACMNAAPSGGAVGVAPTFTSFDGILSQYTGTTKAKMETGDCKTQATAMFTTFETLSGSQLTSLKSANAEYAAWLKTPRGVSFETLTGNATRMRIHAFFMSSDTTASPGQLEIPCYGDTGGVQAAGAGAASTCSSNLKLEPGLKCLPSGVVGEFLTIENKLRVLNCLIFATPHDFWVADKDGIRKADKLKEEDIAEKDRRWDWLGFGDWECTLSPDGPLPSCLKHDVAFSSLQKFAGAKPGKAVGDEVDEAWNPRNKALADAKFRADIAKYGCQNESDLATRLVCPPDGFWGHETNQDMAEFYFNAVSNNVWVFETHRGWPITEQDFSHIEANTTYAMCGDTGAKLASPPMPTLYVASAARRHDSHNTFDAELSAVDGCVDDITIDSYTVVWRVNYRNFTSTEHEVTGSDFSSQKVKKNTLTLSNDWRQRAKRFLRGGISSVEIVRIETTPANIVYGAEFYARIVKYKVHPK